ncbi:ATP-binding cassette domain-containing protein, partial [Mycobacterium tuberculosis]|nr:ATP-binding cassette domain-containing protein [Mycobacterium tuberculosis]
MLDAVAILRDVGCTTQNATLLEDVDLSVAPGECVCLCGPSGSGKTTVTKVINGLIPSFEIGIERTGNVEVCGLDPAACKTYELAGKVG